MTKAQIIKYSVIALVAILLFILLFTVFRSLRRTEVATNQKLIEAKDESAQAWEKTAEIAVKLADTHREFAKERQRQDSIYIVQIQQSQLNYKKLDDRLKNIPLYIQRIANNDDSIRRAYSAP
jgi:hypothetical protein